MMARVTAKNVVVEFPVYGGESRSLKSTFINTATGGLLARDSANRIVVRAISNANFDFREGDRVGIVGHNGSGKSTLLRVIAGAYEPVSGTMEVSGKVASMLSIGLGMDQDATGRENIFLRGAFMGLAPQDVELLVDEICEFSELGDYIDMPLRTYSSGMSMRLAFAISTSVTADVILMDEWLSAGDASFTAKAQKRIYDLVDQAKILVLASHSPEIIRRNCNRILLLEHGRIISETPGGYSNQRSGASTPATNDKTALPQTAADVPAPRSEVDRSIPLAERVQVWTSRGDPSYDENALVTWAKSVDFMIDPRFLAAYERGMDSGHQILRAPGRRDDIRIKWRVAICCWAAKHAARLQGDFVECGTNTGIDSLAVCDYVDFNATKKSFWLFDTYKGIPIEQISDEEKAHGRVEESIANYVPCMKTTLHNFSVFPKARLIEGRVPDTLISAPIKQVCYLALDMSIAYPERAAIEFFWPKLVPGAIVVLANYGWAPYNTIKRTMDEFAALEGCEVMMLPTGQGLLFKA
jgi:ABC-type polysaccharide/polyol phosphate transport system ATPase subunit